MTEPLHIQTFLRSSPAVTSEARFELLRERHAVKAKRHSAYPNLVLFKYSQIDADFSAPLVRECRGIILDEANDWAVVSRSFDKFFNHGEALAAPIDWSTAVVQEKVDGSLCTLYHYADAWHVQTTGTPDASGPVDGTAATGTFRDYFRRTLAQYVIDLEGLAPHGDQDWCFLFELTGPPNRIVVVHEKASLTLLGARRRTDGLWASPSEAGQLLSCLCSTCEETNVPPVGSYPLQSLADIAESFERLSPLKNEGYVVVDAAYNRIKVKHPGYLALHHAKDGLSTRSFVEIARKGETSEVLTAFPEFAGLLSEAVSRLAALRAEVLADYEKVRHIEGQREFAAAVLPTKCSDALFRMRKSPSFDLSSYFATLPMDKMLRLLGYKDDKRIAEAEL